MSSKNSGAWSLGTAGAQAEKVNDASKHTTAMAAFCLIVTSILRYHAAVFFLNVTFARNSLNGTYKQNDVFSKEL